MLLGFYNHKPADTQFLKFVGIGVLNTALDFLILNFIFLLFGNGGTVWFITAKTISFLGATINSFFWNKHFTFKSSGKYHEEIWPFLIVSCITLLINVVTASLLFRIFLVYLPSTLAANISTAIASIVAFSSNFFGYKYFVFRK